MNNITTPMPHLELNDDIQALFDETAIQQAITLFSNTLKTDGSALQQAHASGNKQETDFFAEKLYGAAVYFKLPQLHIVLKEAMITAHQHALTQATLDKVHQEINKVLEMVNQ